MRFVNGDRGASKAITSPTSASISGTDTGERRNSRNSGGWGRDDAGRGQGDVGLDAGRGRGDIRRGDVEDEPDHATAGGLVL
ncbi:hypothetical protein PC120_g14865 [Phytophthora cactorum]|nr:hypothetical protein PC120_g14865 [Phytophthora cactorum]